MAHLRSWSVGSGVIGRLQGQAPSELVGVRAIAGHLLPRGT